MPLGYKAVCIPKVIFLTPSIFWPIKDLRLLLPAFFSLGWLKIDIYLIEFRSFLCQVCGLVISVLATIINAVYMEPKVTALMMERYTYEKELGYGDSIGPIKDKTLKQDEKYLQMTHRFCVVHGFTSMANILSYTGCIVHLWYLTKSQVILI